MIAQFNFGSESSAVPSGYTLDFGEAYDDRRSYGWITQDSVNTETAVPLSIVGNGRDRDASANQIIDTFIHLQYSANNPTAVTTPAAWEYAVANGRYRVNLSVGDSDFIDSSHTINVEGRTVINGFTPTEGGNPFRRVTSIVEVADGKLTIDAIDGENTKLNFVKVSSITEANINFGLANSNIPSEYFRDSGLQYNAARGYGWVSEESATTDTLFPVDISDNGRDRGIETNNLLDTLINMQQPEEEGVPVPVPAAWVYDIPNGVYQVSVNVGDAEFVDGDNHIINVEGEEFISFTPTAENTFGSATKFVEVTDEQLTLDAVGGTNTKINFINIAPVVDVTVNFGLDPELPDGVLSDVGAAYNTGRGYGWIAEDSIGDNPVPLDLLGNQRDRGVLAGDLSDSLVHMQYPERINRTDVVKTRAAWEYDLPNGRYEVKVSVGDTSYVDSVHVINIEGENVIPEFTPTGETTLEAADSVPDTLFTMGTTTVDINDGKLTIDAIGGDNTKINFIEIETVIPAETGVLPN